jgi:hypothetical protein
VTIGNAVFSDPLGIAFFVGGATMLNALKQAARYRDLAEECCRLAAFSFSTQMQNHHFQMAEHYSTLAEAVELEAPTYAD